jgi:hypothetical protein
MTPAGWRGWLLPVCAAVFLVAALLWPAMPQPLSYHAFADTRAFGIVPNALNVLSNLPFLIAGAWGLAQTARTETAYRVFFLGAVLTAFGSAWYHLAPDNARLVWDRLPMTMGFTGLLAAAIGERVSSRLGQRLLWPLLAVGAGTVLYWQFTEALGHGNVVPYAAFQAGSVAAVLILIAGFPDRRFSHGGLLAWAAAFYGLAKLFEAGDMAVFRYSGGVLSGHTLKHLLAAGAVFAIARQLRLREPLPDSTLAALP